MLILVVQKVTISIFRVNKLQRVNFDPSENKVGGGGVRRKAKSEGFNTN